METSGNIIWKSSKFVTEFANTDIVGVVKGLAKEIKLDILESKFNLFVLAAIEITFCNINGIAHDNNINTIIRKYSKALFCFLYINEDLYYKHF